MAGNAAEYAHHFGGEVRVGLVAERGGKELLLRGGGDRYEQLDGVMAQGWRSMGEPATTQVAPRRFFDEPRHECSPPNAISQPTFVREPLADEGACSQW